MSDSSKNFLPNEGQLCPIAPIDDAVAAANRIRRDRELAEEMKAFKAEGTVPPHAAKESGRAEAVVVAKRPPGGMARRQKNPKPRQVPVLLGGRPNTDPGIGPTGKEAAARPQTQRGLGEPEAAHVAKAEAETELEPPLAAVLAPPDPSQEVMKTSPPNAQVPEVVAVDAQKAEPPLPPVASTSTSTPASAIDDRTDVAHNPLATQTPEAFQLAQQGFEREAEGFEPNQLRIAREQAKTLDPNSERYLQLAEHWLDLGVRILNDQASADRDKPRVEARKALRFALAQRAEAKATERAQGAPRRRLLVLAGVVLLGVAGAAAYFYRNADAGSGAPSAIPQATGVSPVPTPVPSVTSTNTTAPASASAVGTSTPTPPPSETARSTAPSTRPSAAYSAAPSAATSSARPPTTAAPATSSSGSFGAWKGND